MKTIIKRLPDLSAVITRFPVPAALMAVFTLIIIIVDPRFNDEPLGRLLLGFVISAYAAFCLTIIREAKDKKQNYSLQILVALGICVAAWFSDFLRLNLIMALAAVLLFLGNAILWRQSRNDLQVWDFTHKIWTGAVFATVGSVIFLIGILAIQFALKSLFDIRINNLMEDLILPVGFGFLAPLYWLSTIPQTDEDYTDLLETPGFVSKAVAFFGTWLLSPLTLIYALILVAYAVKIILMRDLPKGEIAGLTTPFLAIGTLTWLVLQPPFIKEKFLAKLFTNTWFFLSIPAALLLAVSVFVRVQNYGLTPERFALILAVLWALGAGLWFILAPKTKRDIRFIPGLACILFLLGTFTSDVLSLKSQTHRLETNLRSSGLVSNSDKIVKGNIADKKAAQNAKGALIYLFTRDEQDSIRGVLSEFGYKGAYKRSDVFDALGIENLALPSRYNSNFSSRNYNGRDNLIDVKNYDLLSGPHSVYLSTKNSREVAQFSTYTLRIQNNELELYKDEDKLANFDAKKWVKALPNDPLNPNIITLSTPVVPLYYEGDLKIDLYIKSINETIYEDEQDNTNLAFYILLAE